MPIPSLKDIVPDKALPIETDVVVIGGGIIGVSTALYLAKEGLRVCVCEKGKIGAEQSGRNWGWVRQMGREDAEMPLSLVSLGIWRSFSEQYGVDLGYRESGITYLSKTAKEIKQAEGWAETGNRHKLPQTVSRDNEIATLLHGIQPGFRMALHTASDGRAEPSLAAPGIANVAQAHGAQIYTQCAVRGIETNGGKVTSVVTERGEIRCKKVVIAGGAWTRLFLGNLGINFPQLKLLGSVARVEGVTGVPDMPVGGGGFAYRPRLDGGYTIARRGLNDAHITPDSFRLFFDYMPVFLKSWDELSLKIGREFLKEWSVPRHWKLDEPSPFEKVRILDPMPNEQFIEKALKTLSKAFPEFEKAKITHQWAGLIDATPDGMPVISEIEGHSGLFISSGYSGHGFGLGPGAGLLTAQIVAGTKPCVDPEPYSFRRFQ
jgi:glycine/D-amino acid oxidase-like deaminating enzyme